eukprot:1356547-Pyramimonas_sp.AAC.1
MNSLLSGLMPTRDWDSNLISEDIGQDSIAANWCACLVQVRGDWQFYNEVFGVPQWRAAERMCWLCAASSTIPHLYWTDFSRTAGWRDTRTSHADFIDYLTRSGQVIPMLFQVVIGLKVDCIMIDILHAMDLGLQMHIAGN